MKSKEEVMRVISSEKLSKRTSVQGPKIHFFGINAPSSDKESKGAHRVTLPYKFHVLDSDR